MITASKFSAEPHLGHAFFTRSGGVSIGIYAGLNCGYGSGDNSDAVAENRRRAMAQLGLGRGDLNTLYQIHSANVVRAERAWPLAARPRADALVTNTPGLAIGIMTADCAPVLFADPEAGVIGAAHAGWKGALGGVLGATVDEMEALGAVRSRIIAAIGPCIHQSSYEVGPEFPTPFLEQDASNQRFFIPSPQAGHHLFDLPGYVGERLSSLGLADIEDVSVDTYKNEEAFYSFRRTTHRREADYGRGLSAITLNPPRSETMS